MAITRESLLRDISAILASFRNDIEQQNSLKLYNMNLMAENFYAGLLNLIYDYKLENANTPHHDEPGIDLIDKGEQLVIQVTATADSTKIRHSIDEFLDYNPTIQNYHLIMLILSHKQKSYTATFDTRGQLQFDKDEDIWDVDNLLADMKNPKIVSIARLQSIKEYLENELTGYSSSASRSPSLRSNFAPNSNEVIGRDQELATLEALFNSQGAPGSNRVISIRGIGGSGKSVLAKKYAELHQSNYEYIIEVSSDAFKSAIKQVPIANAENHPSLTDDTQRLLFLREEMSKHHILLIVHDYNTNDDSDAHNWSSLPCDVILTTWNDQSYAKELHLNPQNLSDKTAGAIMRYYYLLHASEDRKAELATIFDSDPTSVNALIQKVERHPLTLKLLASQMTCLDDEIISPSEMLAELEAEGFHDKPYFDFTHTHEAGDQTESQNTTAWNHLANIYARAIEKEKTRLSSDQMEALRYMTLVGPVHGISKARFEAWTGLNRYLLNDLERQGWIQYDKDNVDYLDLEEKSKAGTYHMPMMIGEVLHQVDGLISTCDNSKAYINRWWENRIDHLIGYEIRFALQDHSIVLAEHLQKEESEDYANLLGQVGSTIYFTKETMIQQKKALSYQEKALEINAKVLGENHVDTAVSYNNIGASFWNLGDYEKSLKYQEKALEINVKVLGENHTFTANSYNNVGCIYEELGEREKGLEYKEKALEIRMKVLGENHVDTASSYNNVGYSYRQIGDVIKGLVYYKKALEIRTKVLGENHVDTASSYNNVGYSYCYMGKIEKAIECYEKAYYIYLLNYGPDHQQTITVKENLDFLKSQRKN